MTEYTLSVEGIPSLKLEEWRNMSDAKLQGEYDINSEALEYLFSSIRIHKNASNNTHLVLFQDVLKIKNRLTEIRAIMNSRD